MARIDWVERRLLNWARWSATMGNGGLGYASVAAIAMEAAMQADPGARIPVDEIEAAVTDRAVASLKLGHGHLHRTVELYYLKGVGIKRTAELLKRAESTVHSHLGQVHAYLARWFNDRAAGHGAALEDWHGAMVQALPKVQLLPQAERDALVAQLRAERALKWPVFEGPPKPPDPPFRRNRPILRLKRGSFTP